VCVCLFVDTRKETRLELSISKSVDTIIIRPVRPVADPWGTGAIALVRGPEKHF